MIIYKYIAGLNSCIFQGIYPQKNPRNGPGDFEQGFMLFHYSMHVFPVVNRVMPVVLNRAIMLCVNLLAHSRAFRSSQQCRALYIQEKKVHVNIHIDMQISPHICSKW